MMLRGWRRRRPRSLALPARRLGRKIPKRDTTKARHLQPEIIQCGKGKTSNSKRVVVLLCGEALKPPRSNP